MYKFREFWEEYGNFMQCSEWAAVKENWRSEYIIVRSSDGQIKATMLVLIKKIPLLNISFLYAPRGPVCDLHDEKTLAKVFEGIRKIAEKQNAFAIKIDPLIDENDVQAIDNLRKLGFSYNKDLKGYGTVQCRENYLLDIDEKTINEVMSGFKSKCRYNIRLAEKKGVRCGFYGYERIDDFMHLMRDTARRDGFDIRNKEYFARILKSFNSRARLCMCYLGDMPLSGALMIEYAHTVTYVYGCSSNEYRNYMPNYLMQYTMIKYACEHNCKLYDFGGVPYYDDPTHKNYGVYKFKTNFGGDGEVYAGEFDYIFKPMWAKIFGTAWRIRKILEKR